MKKNLLANKISAICRQATSASPYRLLLSSCAALLTISTDLTAQQFLSGQVSLRHVGRFQHFVDVVYEADSDRYSVSAFDEIGDFNGDGFFDFAFSLNDAEVSQETIHIIFGGESIIGATQINSLTEASDSSTLQIISENRLSSLSSAGDINNDGFDDLLVGSSFADGNGTRSGQSHVVFGGNSLPNGLNLSSIESSGALSGFTLNSTSFTYSGETVSGVGDINGDGFSDIAVAAPRASRVYVIFGGQTYPTSIDLSTVGIPGEQPGFVLMGASDQDDVGSSIAGNFDFNNDGISELLIGSGSAEVNSARTGQAFIIFGSTMLSGEYELAALGNIDGFQGVTLNGYDANGGVGSAVTGLIDINDDGYDEAIVTAPFAGGTTPFGPGVGYVIYGGNGIDEVVDLATVGADGGTAGFKVIGGNRLGDTIDTADVNGDGVEDILVSIPENGGDYTYGGGPRGHVYLIYGDSGLNGEFASTELNSVNGLQGVRFFSSGDGMRVSSLKDFNGDGIDDVLMSGPGPINTVENGLLFIHYGEPQTPSDQRLATTNRVSGYKVAGANAQDSIGSSIAEIGDFNGDSINDYVISSPTTGLYGSDKGIIYIIFGGFDSEGEVSLATLNQPDSIQGVLINAASIDDLAGYAVDSAGDVNNDGYSDVIIGAPDAHLPNENNFAGQAYVIYGGNDITNVIELSDFVSDPSTQGVLINGLHNNSRTGKAVAGLGDINGDGIDDIGVGTPYARPNGGTCHIIFGSDELTTVIELSQFNADAGMAGLNMYSLDIQENSCIALAGVGDVNHDGVSDLVVGATIVGQSSDTNGRCYLVYGSTDLDNDFALNDIGAVGGVDGAILNGTDDNFRFCEHLSAAGDVNDDGIDDWLVGEPRFNNGSTTRGAAYLIHGDAELTGTYAIDQLNLQDGFSGIFFDGRASEDQVGRSVSDAGDVNGDGVADILIGAPDLIGSGFGEVYLLYGGSDLPHVIELRDFDELPGNMSALIQGPGPVDRVSAGVGVTGIGDSNQDGYDDFIITSIRYDNDAENVGVGFVVHGGPLLTDISVTKTNNANHLEAGQPTEYIIDVTHLGEFRLTNVSVRDILPSTLSGATWTCESNFFATCTDTGIGNIDDLIHLDKGGQVTYHLIATVVDDESQEVRNTVSVELPSRVVDINVLDNSDVDHDPIALFADSYEDN